MKQFKKMLLAMMCVCVMLGCVACGNNDAMDNGANQTDTTLDDANGNGNGVVGEIGEDVVDGVDDIGNDVVDGVEDVGDDVENAADRNDNNTGDRGNNGAENKEVPKDEKNR